MVSRVVGMFSRITCVRLWSSVRVYLPGIRFTGAAERLSWPSVLQARYERSALALSFRILLLPGGPVPAADLPPARDIAPFVEATIPIAGDWAAFGFDSLWVTNRSRVYRVDPADNTVKEVRLEGGKGHTRGPAVGEGAVWIASPGAEFDLRLDPASDTVTLKIPRRCSTRRAALPSAPARFGRSLKASRTDPNKP